MMKKHVIARSIVAIAIWAIGAVVSFGWAAHGDCQDMGPYWNPNGGRLPCAGIISLAWPIYAPFRASYAIWRPKS
jgi:hypothetical protein